MIDRMKYRCTAGLCLGVRGGLNSALVVLARDRTDSNGTLYVVSETEFTKALDVEAMAAALKLARDEFHPVMTVGYYGGKDEDEIFKTVSLRLGQHICPSPNDVIVPMQLLVDDFRSGRIKAREDSIVARDVEIAIWHDGTPSHTGILTALRCAHWAAMQYARAGKQRARPSLTGEEKTAAMNRERIKKMERPF